jgi:cytochrome c-type biogenesis protein CcmH
MPMLWVIFALLVLLALWFVLPPLLQAAQGQKRDETRTANVLVYQDQCRELEADLRNGLIAQEQYQQDRDELERRLLKDVEPQENAGSSPEASSPVTKRLAYGVGTAIPVAAIALYFFVGNPKALTPQRVSEAASPFAGRQSEMTRQQIADNVEKLAKRLDQNPNDAQGWVMLARSYIVLERYPDAAKAYARATALNNRDANLWADYAEALAMANGQRLAGKPAEALDRALQIDPKNQKALALAGGAALEAKDYTKALEYWQRLLPLLRPDSEDARIVSDQIARAKELAAGRGSR